MSYSSSTMWEILYSFSLDQPSKIYFIRRLPLYWYFFSTFQSQQFYHFISRNSHCLSFLLVHDIITIQQQQNCMTETNSLLQWLGKLGITKQLNNSDILSGVTVNSALTKVIPNYTVRISLTNTASTRINNWNTVINQLQKINIHVGQQDKSKILNGDDKIVYNILYDIREYYNRNRQDVEVDINKIDARGDPKTAKSLLQLFILLIIKHYGFSVKQAVALLSNDSKYLAHILAKGFKQNPKPVENMLLQLQKLLPQILTFCKNQQNETFFLKSIKPGLISKHLSITEITLELLTMFTKNLTNKYDIVKVQLMSTLLLSLRRHSCQLSSIIRSLTQIIGINRNFLTLFQLHGSPNQVNLLLIELINLSESEGQISQIFEIYKLDQYIGSCLMQIKSADLFSNSASLILKLSQHNYEKILGNSQYLNSLIEVFNGLNISKKGDVIIFTNIIFAFLQLFGRRKISIAPQFFKLAVERYRQAINEDQSHNYLLNFLQIFEFFPSIPASAIAQAIVIRYEKGTTLIGQLQLQILLNSLSGDQKLALRIFNIVTKLFVEEVGSVESISSIIETIIRRFDSKIIFDLTVKFAKVCLAVYYANLRKLNYSKSLIDGTIKLDISNIFYKAKNSQIQKLLTTLILIRDEKINKAVEPLVCYSFFQSQMKNKDQADGLKKIMLLLGDEEQLRKTYETDAKLMLEDVRNEGKKKSDSKQKVQNLRYKETQSKVRVSSDASLLLKKKQLLYNSLAGQKVNPDAQKGLQKYNKVYLQRMAKLSQQQQKKMQDEEKKEELRRKFTMKILQKGIKVSSKQVVINNLYEFNSKQKQLEKDLANDFSYLPFYDPQHEEERDVKAVQYVMKKYSKIFKVYYHNYGGKLRPNTIKLFEDISQRGNLMQSANVWRLLRDHQLDNFITVKEVQYIVQNINAHLKKQFKDSSVLDYEVFQNFIIQCSLAMFSRPPKDMRSHPISQMIEEVINKLKQHAQENRIDEKLFEDGQNIFSLKTEQIADLNSKLEENSDYILPEGYKKITVKRMIFDHKFYLHALEDSYKDVFEVLNEIMFEHLGFNIIEPYSITITKTTARPVLYQTESAPMMKERSLSSIFPRESKISKEVNEDDEQNLQRTDLNGSKIENKYLKEKKFKDEQKKMKQEEYEKKRQQRDKELKQMLQKYRQKQQQIQKQKQQKQQQETRKQQQEKKRREKYEQQIKKKVTQYMQKKKIDKNKEQQQIKRKKQEQFKNYQKLKQDIQKKKKMVEESKQKKLEQAQAIKQKQAQQKKRKQQQNKQRQLQKKEKTKRLLEQYRQKRQKAQQQKLKTSQNQKDDLKKSPIKKKHLVSSKQLSKNDNVQKKQIEVQQIGNQTNGDK